MSAVESPPGLPIALRRNLLLRSLDFADAALLAPHLEPVFFRPGGIVTSPDVPLTRAFFPETVVASFREALAVDHRPDVLLVGSEGMIGWPLLLGCAYTPMLGVAQLRGGAALSICAEQLREACRISPTLNLALLRFVNNLMLQMACTIVSHAADAIERRVARWLLMIHDRAEGEVLALTHDHMSNALSTRRASVTECLHLLEGDGIVKCTRGRILIRDRKRLEETAGGSYGMVEAHYAIDIAAFGKLAGRAAPRGFVA